MPQATEIFLDSIDDSDERLVAVSRVLAGAVVVRGAQLAIVKHLKTSDHVQLHADALAYIVKKYAVLRDGKKKDASTRALGLFKALANLLIGLDGQGALKVYVLAFFRLGCGPALTLDPLAQQNRA